MLGGEFPQTNESPQTIQKLLDPSAGQQPDKGLAAHHRGNHGTVLHQPLRPVDEGTRLGVAALAQRCQQPYLGAYRSSTGVWVTC